MAITLRVQDKDMIVRALGVYLKEPWTDSSDLGDMWERFLLSLGALLVRTYGQSAFHPEAKDMAGK